MMSSESDRTIRRALCLLFAATVPAPAVCAQGGAWAATAPLPTPRWGHASGVVNQRLYVVSGGPVGAGSTSAVESFDPITNSWRAEPPLSPARCFSGSGVIGTKLYVVGGCNQCNCGIPTMTATLSIFDTATNAWSTGPNLPAPRGATASAAIGGKLYVAGGFANSASAPQSQLWIFDPSTSAWSAGPAVPWPVWGMGSAVLNGRLHLVGGYTGVVFNPATPYAGHCAFDPATNAWTVLASPPNLTTATGCGVAGGMLYLVSGQLTTGATTDAWAYDDASDSWWAAPDVGTARNYNNLHEIAGKLYVAGWGDPNAAIGSTEALTPAWRLLFAAPAGPGSIVVRSVNGTPGHVYNMAVTVNQGLYPNGWLYGIDMGLQELFAEWSIGFPFLGVLDAQGASPPFVIPAGIPPGITLYAVSMDLVPGTFIPLQVTAPISFTT